MCSLRYINVAMVTVLKNVTNVITALGEMYLFKKHHDSRVWTALFLMVWWRARHMNLMVPVFLAVWHTNFDQLSLLLCASSYNFLFFFSHFYAVVLCSCLYIISLWWLIHYLDPTFKGKQFCVFLYIIICYLLFLCSFLVSGWGWC